MEKIVLNVEGMTCSHCENRVKNAVLELGAKTVSVSLADKTVTVESDLTAAAIKAAIEDAGYDVV